LTELAMEVDAPLLSNVSLTGGSGMMKFVAIFRTIAGALALLVLALGAQPASAQQPTSVNPQASAVKEDLLLQELNRISGRCTLPDQKACTIEQPAGRDWRHFHEVTLRWIGGIVILGILVVLVAFYLWRGMVRIQSGRSGRTIVRFTAFERFVHWMTASCFIILAISGLNITFGKPLLLPLMSPEAFTAWSEWAKYAHNYLSFPFTLGVILIFVIWIAGNIPNRVDLEWLKRGGGIVGHDHPPAYRFNAGQKMIYWIVVLGGAAVAISGYVLMFPFYGTDIQSMQAAQIVHGVVAMLFVAAMIGHIYIGTIGMEGAFEAMGTGTVDLNWAKEHHSLWLEEERARIGSRPTQRQPAATPAE
jgi:formate dehydrogenase subunit gamma